LSKGERFVVKFSSRPQQKFTRILKKSTDTNKYVCYEFVGRSETWSTWYSGHNAATCGSMSVEHSAGRELAGETKIFEGNPTQCHSFSVEISNNLTWDQVRAFAVGI
jgi:hypothetical protein